MHRTRQRQPSSPRRRPCLLPLAAMVALGLAAPRPATAQSAPRAPTLSLVYGAGAGSPGPAGQGIVRYTLWLSPTLGLGPEVFFGIGLAPYGPVVIAGGADLALAWRRPGRVADLVLRAGVGGAYYTFSASPLGAPGAGPTPELDGGALDAAAEASLVFHPWAAVGLVVGARGTLLALAHDLGPWWSAELMLGVAWTR